MSLPSVAGGIVKRSTSLFSSISGLLGETQSPPPVPTTPTRSDPSIQAQGAAERDAARRRRGRSSTIRTLLSQDTNTQGKTLLGQ